MAPIIIESEEVTDKRIKTTLLLSLTGDFSGAERQCYFSKSCGLGWMCGIVVTISHHNKWMIVVNTSGITDSDRGSEVLGLNLRFSVRAQLATTSEGDTSRLDDFSDDVMIAMDGGCHRILSKTSDELLLCNVLRLVIIALPEDENGRFPLRRQPHLKSVPIMTDAVARLVVDNMLCTDAQETIYFVYSQRRLKPDGSVVLTTPLPLRVAPSVSRVIVEKAKEMLYTLAGSDAPNELERYAYEEDSDLDDVEFGGTAGAGFSRQSAQVAASGAAEPSGARVEPIQGRNSVRVIGAAYRTWVALIYFLYTGQIHFLPLKSTGKR
ncbi:hypothetical protein CONPUDRAFT_164266, partial [Coniophora puteana RWD-64-598 SS2]